MSDTLTSYLISVAILCALALFIPCIESLSRLLRRRSPRDVEPVSVAQPANNSREIA